MPRKRPFAVQRYRYIITDIEAGTTRQCVHEPEGWDAYGVTFGRETNISNVVKGYVSAWTFLKEDARWLRDMLLTKGPNRRLRLRVLDTAVNLGTSDRTVYDGDIDLTQAEWDSVKFTAPTSEGGFFKALENKWDETFDVDFDTYVKFEGAVMKGGSEITGTSSVTGSYSPIKTNHACFIPKMKFSDENELNNTFLNETELQQIKFSIPDSMVLNYYVESMTKINNDNGFFRSGTRYVRRMTLNYDFSLNCRINNLAINSNGTIFQCYHRLSLYGVPTTAFATESKYLGYQVDNMGTQQSTTTNYRLYRQLKVNHTTAKMQHNSTDKAYAVYQADFKGTFELTDLDTKAAAGMTFFLVLEIDCGKYGNTMQYMTMGSEITARVDRNNCSFEYALQPNPLKYIAAVPAYKVFQSVINGINGGRYNVNIDTKAFEAVSDGDLLTAGEGMRNKPNPSRSFNMHGKLTTSLSSFLKYAYAVYGYQIGVDFSNGAYNVYLAHFTAMYEKSNVIGTIDHYNDLKYSLCRDMLYSTIRVGYDTDSDIFDGVNEYNCIQMWQTPNTEIEGNELDLTSPYNASSKAVETFLFKNYAEWGDTNREETDIYLIHGELSGTYPVNPKPNSTVVPGDLYILSRYIHAIGGVDYHDTQWNLKYTPKRMLMAHQAEFNSWFALDAGKDITFGTCDMNSDLVSYDGPLPNPTFTVAQPADTGLHPTVIKQFYPAGSVFENEKLTIGTSHRFIPVTAEFSAIAGKSWIPAIEAARLGVIVLKLGENAVKGYIADGDSSVTINPIKTSESTFTILLADL